VHGRSVDLNDVRAAVPRTVRTNKYDLPYVPFRKTRAILRAANVSVRQANDPKVIRRASHAYGRRTRAVRFNTDVGTPSPATRFDGGDGVLRSARRDRKNQKTTRRRRKTDRRGRPLTAIIGSDERKNGVAGLLQSNCPRRRWTTRATDADGTERSRFVAVVVCCRPSRIPSTNNRRARSTNRVRREPKTLRRHDAFVSSLPPFPRTNDRLIIVTTILIMSID